MQLGRVQGPIGQAEREGADSGRPELEGRAALSCSLTGRRALLRHKSLVTGFQSRRTSIVPSSSYMRTVGREIRCSFSAGHFRTAFGLESRVGRPDRDADADALVYAGGSAYRGGDLRFFFGGQINSFATDTGGLTNVQGPVRDCGWRSSCRRRAVLVDAVLRGECPSGKRRGCSAAADTLVWRIHPTRDCRFRDGLMPTPAATMRAGNCIWTSARIRWSIAT